MLPRQVITAIFAAIVSQGLVVSALPQPGPSNKSGSERLNDRSSNGVNGVKVVRADLEQSHAQDQAIHVARSDIAARTASTAEIIGYASAGVTVLGVGGHYIHVFYKKVKKGAKDAKKRRNQATQQQWMELVAHVAGLTHEPEADVERAIPITTVVAEAASSASDDEDGGVPIDGSSTHGTTGSGTTTSGSSGGVPVRRAVNSQEIQE